MSEAPQTGEGQQPAPAPEANPAPAPANSPAPAPEANPAPAPEAPPAPTPEPERPSWLPDKFKNPEDLAKAYSELERKQSGEQQPQSHLPPADKVTVEDAQIILKNAGLDADALMGEWADKGVISEETFKRLEEGGVPRDFVSTWVEGRQAVMAEQAKAITDVVGGHENFRRVSEWAKVNAPPGVVRAYNDALDGGNLDLIKLAARGLDAAYRAANGNRPTLISGEGQATDHGGFASREEALAAMSSPRYRQDPAFRRDVEAKLARNPVFYTR